MRAVNTAVRLFADTFEPGGPILELGSKYLPGSAALSNLRPLFPGREYLGCDVRPGLGVDRVENAEELTLADASFAAVLMCDMLGHTPRPARVVAEARRVLRDGGLTLVTVPFNYRLNGFPTDYWRFTASGLWVLLDDGGFEDICVFALGPLAKPRVVVGVAAKGASHEHKSRRIAFETIVQETYSRNRLHAHLDTIEKAGRDLLGTALGRASLGVVFFDPHQSGGYWDVAAGPKTGDSSPD